MVSKIYIMCLTSKFSCQDNNNNSKSLYYFLQLYTAVQIAALKKR